MRTCGQRRAAAAWSLQDAEIKLRAERRAGEMLSEMENRSVAVPKKRHSSLHFRAWVFRTCRLVAGDR